MIDLTYFPVLQWFADWWWEWKCASYGVSAPDLQPGRAAVLQKVHKTAELVTDLFGAQRTEYKLHTKESDMTLTFHVKNTKKIILTMGDVHFCSELVKAALGEPLQAKLKGDDTIFMVQTNVESIRTSRRRAGFQKMVHLWWQATLAVGIFLTTFWVVTSMMEHGSTCVWLAKGVYEGIKWGIRTSLLTLVGGVEEEDWEVDDED